MASHGREYRWILAWRSISSQYNSRRYKCRLIPSWSSNRLRLALMSCHHNPQQEQQWTAAALKYTNKTRSCKLLHSVHSVFGINVYQCLPHIATSDLNSVIATDKRQVRMKRTLMFGKSSRKTSQDNLWKHEMRSQLVLLQISAIYNLHHGKIRVENPSRPPCKRDGRIRRTLIKLLIISLWACNSVRFDIFSDSWQKKDGKGMKRVENKALPRKVHMAFNILGCLNISKYLSTQEQTHAECMQHQHHAAQTCSD